jgi:hypothetical protein
MMTPSLYHPMGAVLVHLVLHRGCAQANAESGESQLCLKLGVNPP